MSLLLILIESPIKKHKALQADAVVCRLGNIVSRFLNYFFPILFFIGIEVFVCFSFSGGRKETPDPLS